MSSAITTKNAGSYKCCKRTDLLLFAHTSQRGLIVVMRKYEFLASSACKGSLARLKVII